MKESPSNKNYGNAMEEFMLNTAIASFGLIVLAGIVLSIFNWLEEELMRVSMMDLGDWIMIAIFFGVAALVASTM